MMSKKVYLAGPISGLTFDDAQDWRAEFANRIDPQIACYSPLRGKDYLKMRGPLEGSYDEFPLSTDQGITARDRFDCMGSDLVIFNLLGATRISIGTMIELGWADAARNPSILIMEKTGNPHEHPMLRQTTQFRVDNLKDGIAIAEIILLPSRKLSLPVVESVWIPSARGGKIEDGNR
jgi:nucleoside 2-deoxyribosyltransferase